MGEAIGVGKVAVVELQGTDRSFGPLVVVAMGSSVAGSSLHFRSHLEEVVGDSAKTRLLAEASCPYCHRAFTFKLEEFTSTYLHSNAISPRFKAKIITLLEPQKEVVLTHFCQKDYNPWLLGALPSPGVSSLTLLSFCSLLSV